MTGFPTRKLSILLLAAGLLCACGDSQSLENEGSGSPTSSVVASESGSALETTTEPLEANASSAPPGDLNPAANPEAPGLRRWVGDLDAMEEHRVLRILTVYGPGRFHLDEGRGVGIVAEMATRLEEHLNKDPERKHIRMFTLVIPIARDQLVPALLAGRGDVIAAGLTITSERQEIVDFSIPASKVLNEILVTGPSAPQLDQLEDLSGKTVYLRESSSYRESVDALNDRLEAQGLPLIDIEVMPGSLEDDDLIEMVNAGLLPWAVVDDYKPQMWEGVFKDLVVRNDLVFREGGRTAWALRKDSPLLKASVDAFLKKNRAGTLYGNILINRYVRDFDWASNALGDEDYQRFNDLQYLFQKYGELYEMEYLFAAAQGYQESRLDQSVRSHAGAVGVMQLLPSTASDKSVGIPNIHEVEPNIHAGIKYMDYLRDRYFDDPEVTPLNQALLALGAYNAGPSRMIRLRAKAAERGYDPNVWFDNVELIAAEDIGRETVQYVSNIYRYYLTYRMVAKQELKRAEARRAIGISDALDQ
ncbi:MAG: membrane-bound lytic murein transglycosylase MltF [Glaciecola sp.]|jgi:membrane-bound lytic murein transglycosylase MltF|uniref:transglycosylase SLT domain-containing protein n=1 Tax=Congregibacter sp. TaxID=2744308 RepID=UPI0039E46FC8